MRAPRAARAPRRARRLSLVCAAAPAPAAAADSALAVLVGAAARVGARCSARAARAVGAMRPSPPRPRPARPRWREGCRRPASAPPCPSESSLPAAFGASAHLGSRRTKVPNGRSAMSSLSVRAVEDKEEAPGLVYGKAESAADEIRATSKLRHSSWPPRPAWAYLDFSKCTREFTEARVARRLRACSACRHRSHPPARRGASVPAAHATTARTRLRAGVLDQAARHARGAPRRVRREGATAFHRPRVGVRDRQRDEGVRRRETGERRRGRGPRGVAPDAPSKPVAAA